MSNKTLDCLVIEWEHAEKYLTKAQIETLSYIEEDIESGLTSDGLEPDKDYIVISRDSEIYSEAVSLVNGD